MFDLVKKKARRQTALESAPYDCWRDYDGGVALEFHRTERGFYLRFPERADFSIDLATRQVVLYPAPGEEPSAAADLFANQVAPLLDAYDGALVLHASAVVVDDAVIGFMGGTGRGKSTLAAAFARRGYPFLTDDGLAVDIVRGGYLARANQDSVRLLPDSRAVLLDTASCGGDGDPGRKVRIRDPLRLPHQRESAPIHAVFALGEPGGPEVSIKPLQAAESLDALIRHSFMLDVTDKARMRDHFQRIAAFAECVPCATLQHPRDFARLDFVVDTIIGYVRSLEVPSPDARHPCLPN